MPIGTAHAAGYPHRAFFRAPPNGYIQAASRRTAPSREVHHAPTRQQRREPKGRSPAPGAPPRQSAANAAEGGLRVGVGGRYKQAEPGRPPKTCRHHIRGSSLTSPPTHPTPAPTTPAAATARLHPAPPHPRQQPYVAANPPNTAPPPNPRQQPHVDTRPHHIRGSNRTTTPTGPNVSSDGLSPSAIRRACGAPH